MPNTSSCLDLCQYHSTGAAEVSASCHPSLEPSLQCFCSQHLGIDLHSPADWQNYSSYSVDSCPEVQLLACWASCGSGSGSVQRRGSQVPSFLRLSGSFSGASCCYCSCNSYNLLRGGRCLRERMLRPSSCCSHSYYSSSLALACRRLSASTRRLMRDAFAPVSSFFVS